LALLSTATGALSDRHPWHSKRLILLVNPGAVSRRSLHIAERLRRDDRDASATALDAFGRC
jgi:hypothetical protein